MISKLLNYCFRNEEKDIIFGQKKISGSIEGIELLKQHENLPEEYKIEYEELLDDKQLRKLKILKLRQNAEKVQNKKVNLSKSTINEMAGDEDNDADNEEDEDIEENEDEEDIDENDLEDLEELEEDEEDEDLKNLSLHESQMEEEVDSLEGIAIINLLRY